MEDAELAVDKTREISGGMLAMNYASKHWEDDLNGIVLLDGGTGGKATEIIFLCMQLPKFPIPLSGPIAEAVTHLMGVYALDLAMDMGPLLNSILSLMSVLSIPHCPEVMDYALYHPLDPPLDPVTGNPLEPTTHPLKGEPFGNCVEWATGYLHASGSTNIYEGYNDAESLASVAITFDRYWPLQVYLEYIADLLT